jgi:hypothetical protein
VLPKLVTCVGANLGKDAYPITAALASSNSAPIPSRQPHPHLTWQAPHRPQLEAPACAKLGVRMTGNNRIIIYGRGPMARMSLSLGQLGESLAISMPRTRFARRSRSRGPAFSPAQSGRGTRGSHRPGLAGTEAGCAECHDAPCPCAPSPRSSAWDSLTLRCR